MLQKRQTWSLPFWKSYSFLDLSWPSTIFGQHYPLHWRRERWSFPVFFSRWPENRTGLTTHYMLVLLRIGKGVDWLKTLKSSNFCFTKRFFKSSLYFGIATIELLHHFTCIVEKIKRYLLLELLEALELYRYFEVHWTYFFIISRHPMWCHS